MPSLPEIANKRRRERRASDPGYRAKINKANRASYKIHGEKHKKHKRDTCTLEKSRVKLLKHKYRMTPEEYEALLMLQEGVCAICKGKQTRKDHTMLYVDHDHTTGKIRGLLCDLCNKAIGLLRDSPSLLRSAANYLEK